MESANTLLILAGGRGTRIKNYLGKNSKPMLKFNKKHFLEYLIWHYSKFPLEEIIILAGFRGKEIKKRFHNKVFNFCKVKVIIEKKPLCTGGAVLNAKKMIRSKNFFLVNGDTFFNIDICELLKVHTGSIVMSITSNITYLDNKKLNQISLKKNNQIFFSRNKSKLMNGGVYLINNKKFNFNKSNFSLENDLMPKLIKQKKVTGRIFRNEFLDIGTPKNYKKTKNFLKKIFFKPAAIFDRDNTIIIDKGYTYKTKDFKFKNAGLKILKKSINKYLIFICTNQAGIAKCKFTIKEFYNFMRHLKFKFSQKKIFFNDIIFSPFHTEGKIKKYKKNSSLRKPNNGMFRVLKNKWKFKHQGSFYVGDQNKDLEFAKKSKIKFININN